MNPGDISITIKRYKIGNIWSAFTININMYCNASLLIMIFIILIQTLQHDIDACLLQSLFIECPYMINLYECV